MNMAKKLIEQLGLEAHIEGGYYKRTYQSDMTITLNNQQSRFINTAIYYLLEKKDFSCWHRLKSDEIWHYYCGGPATIYEINHKNDLVQTTLGNPLETGNIAQHRVPANTWLAVSPNEGTEFILTGITVTPGFDFMDFEMGKRAELIKQCPEHAEMIEKLTREE